MEHRGDKEIHSLKETCSDNMVGNEYSSVDVFNGTATISKAATKKGNIFSTY